MNTTFRRIGEACGFEFVHLNTGEAAWETRPDKPEYMLSKMARIRGAGNERGIFVDYHSTTPDLCGIEHARGIHMIRDPRDMLISAIRYHENSDESWLDEQRPKWGGRSFRETLLSYGAFDDRVRFELDTYMGEEIQRMAAFADRPDHERVFRCVRYEDLIADVDMTLFHSLCVHLGLRGMEMVHAMRVFWESSLFGGMRAAAEAADHHHVRDGSAAQWSRTLARSTIGLIQSRIGDQIEKLGYPVG